MGIGRVFVNAVVRKVAHVAMVLVIGAIMSLCGIDDAKAAYPAVTCTSSKNPACSEGEAYAECVSDGQEWVATSFTTYYDKRFKDCYKCNTFGSKTGYCSRAEAKLYSTNPWTDYSATASNETHWYDSASSCSARGNRTGAVNVSLNPTMEVCWDNCSYTGDRSTVDDTYIVSDDSGGEKVGLWFHATFTNNGAACAEGDSEQTPECTAGQKRLADGTCGEQSDCPVGQHKVNDICEPDGVCPTGQVKGPDGSCVENSCSAGRAKGKDGTCKSDADGDGVPDEEEEGNEDGDKFSGGDTCDTPPACSGDAILCGTARIQWRIDCNTRRNTNVTGGACEAMPICTGEKCNAMEYSQLLMQWRTACALEEGGSGGDGDAALGEINAWTKTTGTPDIGEAGVGGDSWVDGEGEEIEPDESGYGLSRSCPASPTVSVFGTTLTFELQPLCDWAGLGGGIVLIMAALGCARIIAGRAT